MQVIRSVEEYDLACKQPCSLIIFSSLKACQPCRLLKQWLESNYTFELEHIYYADIYLPSLSDITDDIFVLPTLHLYQDGQRIKEVEGFNKSEIEPLLSSLTLEPEKSNCTLLVDETPIDESPIDETPIERTVDEILEDLQKRLA